MGMYLLFWFCFFFYFEAEVTFMQEMFLHLSMEYSIEGVP